MKKQLQKALSLAMAAVMCLGLLPAPSAAAGETVAINEKNFPDPEFRNYLSEMHEGRDGVFTVDEIDSITGIQAMDQSGIHQIHDLTGIGFFPEVNYLSFTFHSLTELDLRGNPKLVKLNCGFNKLAKLDVSGNPKLTQLICQHNQLTELDVSGNPELGQLICPYNQLTELDVSKNPLLETLAVNQNHLAALDLSSLSNLRYVITDDNWAYAKDGAPLSTLPGFDPSKASNVQGGSFEDGTIHFTDNVITYTYDTGAKIDGSSCLMDVTLIRSFNDVKYSDFFSESVKWAVENNITAGMGDGSFGSFTPCNRAQIVTFLWSEAGKPEPKNADNPFTDVKETDWFYKPVLWAVENGITSGMTKTEFGPTAACNRAQAMTFLWKAAGQPDASAELKFTDVQKGAWYEKAVQWAVEKGITSGLSDTLFGATADCLRSQIVTFMHKAPKG